MIIITSHQQIVQLLTNLMFIVSKHYKFYPLFWVMFNVNLQTMTLYVSGPSIDLYHFVTYSYADACRNIFNTIKTSRHSSLEKYTSHFIRKGLKGLWKVLLCERWVGDQTELQHIDPHSSGHSNISFLFSWAAQPGAWRPSLCWDMVLILASSLQQIRISCHRGYIIIWRPPTSCERHICTQFNPWTVKIIPWSPDIFDRMHLLFTQVHFSSDSPAGLEVSMLQFYRLITDSVFFPQKFLVSYDVFYWLNYHNWENLGMCYLKFLYSVFYLVL